jgi:protein-S-isoprenylcysteine O-methyltransferase Ste14
MSDPNGASQVISSIPSTPAQSATLAARVGGALFRKRSWLPIPLVVLALVLPGHATAGDWIIGVILVAAGEAIRLAGVAAAGTATRRRSRNVQRLVTYGAFAWTRNPLYIGNFLVWIGFVCVSGVWLCLPLALVLFVVEYSLIVAYEEGVLESIFGQEYLAYKAVTPRWLPRPPRMAAHGSHDVTAALRSELSTFMQYAALVTVFTVKQLAGW